MQTTSSLESKTQKLIVRNNILLVLLVLSIGYIIYQQLNNNHDVIYAKGIVIVDEEGKDRILIGAPVPKSKDRVRDDLEKVKKAWGSEFPSEYINWYQTYHHENFGMLILDDKGFDRLAIGSPTPDPNIGKRIGPATGIEINDEKGFERSGYGLLNVNGKNRVVLGLDNDNGTEGLSLILSDEGNTGLFMKSEYGEIFLGKTKNKNYYSKEYPFSGLVMKNDSLENLFKFNALKKK